MSLFPHSIVDNLQRSAGRQVNLRSIWQRAFTLVEMLVVITVIVIIIGIGAPIIKNISSGNPVSNGVDAISGFLTGARAQAMAQNTYVVVGFLQAQTSSDNPDDLYMAAVRSLNDTFDPNQVYNSTSNPTSTTPSNYRIIGPVVRLKNVTIQTYSQLPSKLQAKLKASNVPPSPSSSSASTSTADFIDCSTKPTTPTTYSAMSFKFQTHTFNWCLIAFTPQGEALFFPNFPATNSTTTPFYSQLFIGLGTSRGGSAVANDYSAAGMVLDGGGGNIRTFRL